MGDFEVWDSGVPSRRTWRVVIVVNGYPDYEMIQEITREQVLAKMIKRYPQYSSMTIEPA